MKKSSGRSWNYLASPECYEPDSAVSDELAPPAELAYDLGAWDRAMSMQKAGKHPLFLEQQLRHAFGLNDLKRMQDIFDALCQGRAISPMSETEYNELARAVVRTYDPELSVQTLIAVALFAYDSSKWELPEAASEQTEFSDTKR